MKKFSKNMVLVIALTFIISLFSACGSNKGTESENTDNSAVTNNVVADTSTPESTIPSSLYAAGNFETDENGIALEKYEYTLPLSESDEVLTYWTSCYTPNYITTEYAESPFPIEVENQTGVNIEYMVIGTEKRAENFSVLLAADDLPDLMSQANYYYTGSMEDGIIKENYFVNIYDYRDYAPNYFYEVAQSPDDVNMQTSVYIKPNIVGAFYTLRDKVYQQNALFVRSDWLDRIGWSAEDIVTWDDTHDLLTAFKTQIDTATYPLLVYNTLEAAGNHWNCFDTLAYVNPRGLGVQVDENGQVYTCNTTFRDRDLMTSFNQWYSEGLIDPDWMSYSNMTSEGCNKNYYADMYGYIALSTTSSVTDVKVLDAEGASWRPVKDPVLKEGQVLHVGGNSSRLYYGNTSISTKCENIELAVTWLDWRYSDKGADLMSWGVEGFAWETNEDGEREVTDFIYQNPDNYPMSMLLLIYSNNTLCDAGLDFNSIHYTFPGGEKVIAAYDYLRDRNYDGAYEYPKAIKLSSEQQADIKTYSTDVMTYISENYLSFLDGSKPLSEWDSYEEALYTVGLTEILAIYQSAYDGFKTA